MKRQRGAALLVILMIAGLLGAFFAMQLLGGASAERDKVRASTLALTQANDALIGFAMANGRLPRPATSAVNGVENPALCSTEASCTGQLPWVTLGVTRLDAWGKVIRYSVTPAFANANFALSTVPTKRVKTRDGVGALVDLKGNPACSPALPAATDTATDCAPALVFSHGKDNFGTTDGGGVISNSSVGNTNLDEISNNTGTVGVAPAGVTFIRRPPSGNTAAAFGGEFDDILVWLSPNILLDRMQKAGKL